MLGKKCKKRSTKDMAYALQLHTGGWRAVGGPAEMRRRALKQALPDVGLAQQQLNVLFGPVARGQRLQKHHDLLEVHATQLARPFDQKGGADVQVEFGEAVFFSLDSVV